MHTIGEEIKNLRQQKGMTQQELADLLFITRQAISSYENSKTTPDLQTLQRLGDIFNTDLIHSTTTEKPIKNYSALIYIGIIFIAVINLLVRMTLKLPLIGEDMIIYIMLLMATTLYFIFNYVIKNEDYTLIAGFDSSLPYHYPTLKKMVLSILHVVLIDILGFMLLFLVLIYLDVNAKIFPLILMIFIFNFIGSILLVNYRYKDQLLLKKIDNAGSQIPLFVFLGSIFSLVGMMWFVMEHFNISNNTPEAMQLLLILFPYLIYNVAWLLITDNKMKKIKEKPSSYLRSIGITVIINLLLLAALYLMASNF
ncbi:helix-turn-helix domain-containing protein [Beduini massiliensis]|uniref:helix-turn-helix domain-containing protein n=1 Tax=Beduini massiliensis TaxID=1585974 RepID=UPI00059A9A97|nr:helix-turn-helix transcriptional regulator [Beduini massiliensis]